MLISHGITKPGRTMASYQLRLCATRASISGRVTEQASFFGVDPSVAYDPSFPVEMFQRLAVSVNESSGLSWAGSLSLMALGFRVLTSPLYVGSVAIGQRRANAAKELTEFRDMAKEAVLLKDQQLVNQIDREYKHRMSSLGLTGNPFQGFGYLFLCQIPWATTFFFALRGMSTQSILFPSFVFESGYFWCDSLALADPYGVLPLLSTAAVALNSRRPAGQSTSGGPASRSLSERDQKYLTYAIRGACFTFLPFTMQLPAGILIFFLINNLFNRITAPLIHRFYSRKP